MFFLKVYFILPFERSILKVYLREGGIGRERERERNIKREKHQSVASCMCHTRDGTCTLDMCALTRK